MRKNRLCGETVTLYHPDPAAQTVCRRVLRGVSWQQGRREKPAAVAGLAVVAYVLPLRLRGRVHHVEAGAWWNASGTGAHSLTR